MKKMTKDSLEYRRRLALGTLLFVVLELLLPNQTLAATQLYFVHNDHLGTPVAVTDQSQNVVWSSEKTPFGETDTSGSIEEGARFPGQIFDQETELHYNYFRDYDPGTGRYIQPDPIGLQGGLNIFGYVYQNPIIYADPYGLFGVGFGGCFGTACIERDAGDGRAHVQSVYGPQLGVFLSFCQDPPPLDSCEDESGGDDLEVEYGYGKFFSVVASDGRLCVNVGIGLALPGVNVAQDHGPLF